MTPGWQIVYAFTGRSLGEILPQFVAGLLLIVVGSVRLSRLGWPGWPFDQRGRIELPFGFIAVGVALVGLEGVFLLVDRDLAAAVAHETCQSVSGQITHIQPDYGGGDREFTIGSREIHYDNHSIGFAGQLCEDVAVCEGDTARLCLRGAEIGRIEKWVGAVPHPTSKPFVG